MERELNAGGADNTVVPIESSVILAVHPMVARHLFGIVGVVMIVFPVAVDPSVVVRNKIVANNRNLIEGSEGVRL